MCVAKPLFRQGKTRGVCGAGGVESLPPRKLGSSRTGPGLAVWAEGPKAVRSASTAWRGDYAPRHIPDRFPVTAGIRSETATRPPGSAQPSRWGPQRGTALLLSPSSRCWPWALQASWPPSSCRRLSSSYLRPFLLPSSWTISYLMTLFSSSSFSSRLFLAFFFAMTISLEVVAKESPAGQRRTIQPPSGNRAAD